MATATTLQHTETAFLSPKEQATFAKARALAQTLSDSRPLLHEGRSCMTFAEEVFQLLLPLKPDLQTLIACLLQCTRSSQDLKHIEESFGKETRATIAAIGMIEGLCSAPPKRDKEQQRRMATAFAGDVRVLLIALMNRLTLLRREGLETRRRQAAAREVFDVYAPICARLGMYGLKYQLESLAFGILYEEDAREIRATLSSLHVQHGEQLEKGKKNILKLLQQEDIDTEVSSRIKHSYSVFRKMHRKNCTQPLDLHDLFGIRILVPSEEDCYRALGVIHRQYRPLPHRMKDYIAMPKPNGYRSLHTTVLGLSFGNHSLPVEIQIRTHAMDMEAEEGIAAHWSYKEHGSARITLEPTWKERMKKLQNLNAEGDEQKAKPEPSGHEDDADILQEEIGDNIFVLTPKGDAIELRKGATPLDFAFRVHSDVGLRFRHALVNDVIVPIDHPLENGDVVKVQTWSLPRPSRHWIQIAKTKHARQHLRTFFEEHIAEPVVAPSPPRGQAPAKHKGKPPIPSTPHVRLAAEIPLPTRFAGCCHPEKKQNPPPPVVGFVTREGLIRIHHQKCHMIAHANPERRIAVTWVTDSSAA